MRNDARAHGRTKIGISALSVTVLGCEVSDIKAKVKALTEDGVVFEKFGFLDLDELGIWTAPPVRNATGGASVAWFKDTYGNVRSLSRLGEWSANYPHESIFPKCSACLVHPTWPARFLTFTHQTVSGSLIVSMSLAVPSVRIDFPTGLSGGNGISRS